MSVFIVLLVYLALERVLPVTGIHWGGKDTEHPGWWWIRKDVRYIRRFGESSSKEEI